MLKPLTADGFRVLRDVPNVESISATFGDDEILQMPGIRAVKTSEFKPINPKRLSYSQQEHDRIIALSEAIKKSKKIKPLIVVHDRNEEHLGPYILEGGHRLPAMQLLGATEIPAVVVVVRKRKGDDKGQADKHKAIRERLFFKNCGTGAGGFKPGNTCGAGGGGGASTPSASTAGGGSADESADSDKIELSHAEQLAAEAIKKKTSGDYFKYYQETYEARRERSQEYPEKYRKKLIALKSRSEKKIEKLQAERKAVCEELQKHELLWCQEHSKHRDKLKNGRRFAEIPEAEREQINDAATKHANSMMPANYKELDKRRSDLWEEMVAERESVRGRAHKLLEVPPSERSSLNVRHDPDSDSGFPKEVLSSGGYVKIESPEVLNNVKDGAGFVQKIIGNRHGDGIEIAAIQLAETHSQRPHQAVIGGKSAICIGKSTSPAVVAHEIGHAIDRDYRVLNLTQGFLVSRAGGESPLPMRKLFPDHGYENGEYGRKDDWLKTFDGDKSKAYYTGKHYEGATEVLSMGLELLYDDPIGFAKRDPEYFNLVVGIMHGDYL